MKIKVIERSTDAHLPQVAGQQQPRQRNLDPALHPFARPREYNRAVTAAKLDRMFAKPFVDALEGHQDGVYCMARDPKSLGCVASGGGDGQVCVWSLSRRERVLDLPKAHKNMVTDVCFTNEPGHRASAEAGPSRSSSRKQKGYSAGGEEMEEDVELADQERGVRQTSRILSCSTDKTVKMWSSFATGEEQEGARPKPLQTFTGRLAFNSISHHRSEPLFATASDQVHIWDETKTEPIAALSFTSLPGHRASAKDNFSGDHLLSVRFNLSETSVLAASGSDRSITLFDLRANSATSRTVLNMRVNQLSFNPMQPPVLLAACEDENLYTFDMRNLSMATQVYKGHVGPVMGCDWSPTGREFVSGSYDKTVRLWKMGEGKSRDVYHTKRMQRIFSSLYTLDSKFVLSGSDDGNLRIWKSNASASIGHTSTRELARRQYRDALREKWSDVGEVGKIERQRYLPKELYAAGKTKREMLSRLQRKEDNRRAHAPKGQELAKPKSERKKGIVRTEE